jgi:peptidoglycan hydrolase CwlO-like protein
MKNLISWAKQNILSLAQTAMLFFTAIVLVMLLQNQVETIRIHQVNEELTQEIRTLDRDTNDIMIKMIEQRGQIMQMGATIEEANEIIQSLVARLQQMQEELNKSKGRSES